MGKTSEIRGSSSLQKAGEVIIPLEILPLLMNREDWKVWSICDNNRAYLGKEPRMLDEERSISSVGKRCHLTTGDNHTSGWI